MSTQSLRIAALAVALAGIGTALCAQAPGAGPGPGCRPGAMGAGHGFRGLNLSADQQAKVKAIHDQHQAALKAKGDAAHAAHQALFEAMKNPATQAGALKGLHDKASATQFDLLLEHRAVRQEILPLLTAEQKVQFDKHPMGMPPHGGRGMGRGQGGPRHGGHGPDGPGPEAPPVKPS